MRTIRRFLQLGHADGSIILVANVAISATAVGNAAYYDALPRDLSIAASVVTIAWMTAQLLGGVPKLISWIMSVVKYFQKRD